MKLLSFNDIFHVVMRLSINSNNRRLVMGGLVQIGNDKIVFDKRAW